MVLYQIYIWIKKIQIKFEYFIKNNKISYNLFWSIFSLYFFRFWFWILHFFILNIKSLFNLFSILFIKVIEVIFRIILLMLWYFRTCSFLFQKFTMFLVQIIEISWLKFGFYSFSFTFIVLCICIFHQFFF